MTMENEIWLLRRMVEVLSIGLSLAIAVWLLVDKPFEGALLMSYASQ